MPVNLPLALALLVAVNLPLVQAALPLDLVNLSLGWAQLPRDPGNLPLAHHCLPPVLVSLGLLPPCQLPLAQANQLQSARQLVHHQRLQVQLCSLSHVTSFRSAAKPTSAVASAHLQMRVCTAASLLLLSHEQHLSVYWVRTQGTTCTHSCQCWFCL